MKRLLFILILNVLVYIVYSQSPNLFNYQSIVRDTDGDILSNENIELEISVLHATTTGAVVYSETFNLTTDQFGAVNAKIGSGTSTDDFNSIDWSFGTYFLKVSVNGNELGVMQLLSVPYAKYADEVGNVFSGDYNDLENIPEFSGWDKNENDDFSGDYNDLTNIPDPVEIIDTSNLIRINNPVQGDLLYFDGTKWQTINIGNEDQILQIESGLPVWKNLVIEQSVKSVGDLYLDGIIFYVSPDGQHGLVASLDDLDDGNGVDWIDDSGMNASGATSFYDGSINTDSIINQQITTSAAQLCRNLGADWYLPSAWELHLLHIAAYEVNKILENDGDSNTNGLKITDDGPQARYWSSTESSNNKAWSFMFNYGYTANSNKNTECRVRAIRTF